jgi:Domain of Unknown Function (DUF1080)
MNSKQSALLTLLSLASVVSLTAAEPAKPKPPEPPAYTTVETAGPDYALQGEYEGSAGESKLGADVIALGDNNFRVVFHRGGLPGAGWDLSAKTEVDGKREGDRVSFKGAWTAALTKSGLSGKTDKGEAFELKRVERHSPTEGAKAPAAAIVLFDGSNADAWTNGQMDERMLLKWGTKTKQAFKDFTLHIEFILPFKPLGRGQGRGNSGVYIQDRYEVQVLDSFGLKGADNECGGIYHHNAPSVNMCYPPLQWQTYDIDFTAPKFDEAGKKTKNGVVSIKHNGTIIHDHLELTSTTPGGGFKEEVPAPGPFQLQNHGNPVFYRNVWVVEK